MNLQECQFWKYLTSVRLALLIIAILATTSIIGTIIPQGESFNFYLERYGTRNAMLFEILALNNMYASFWFKTLLVIFCINIIACSYSRIPTVFKVIKTDNLNISLTKIEEDANSTQFYSGKKISEVVEGVKKSLDQTNIIIKEYNKEGSYLLFFENGAWSRFGAYIVHISILLIILGGIIGSIWGYKAFVMVPEGGSTKVVYSQGDDGQALPLEFEVYCKTFDIDYYQNGTPKEYRSNLSVLEKGNEVLSKLITVNDPLTYRGITFYQSSYQQIPGEYTVNLALKRENSTGQKSQHKVFSSKINATTSWDDTNARFRILSSNKDGHGHGPYEIWFDDDDNHEVTFVINDNQPFEIKRESGTYSFFIKQRFATGLQVAKDPGVWVVYVGCTLMLLGLFVSFFISHRKIWIAIKPNNSDKSETTVILRGAANKNKEGLVRYQEKIASNLLETESLSLRRI